VATSAEAELSFTTGVKFKDGINIQEINQKAV
jgi:hypothetical protein